MFDRVENNAMYFYPNIIEKINIKQLLLKFSLVKFNPINKIKITKKTKE